MANTQRQTDRGFELQEIHDRNRVRPGPKAFRDQCLQPSRSGRGSGRLHTGAPGLPGARGFRGHSTLDRVLRLSEIRDLALFTTKREIGHWLRVAPIRTTSLDSPPSVTPGAHHQKRMRQVGRASKDRFGWEFEVPVDVDDLGSASGSSVLDVHGRVVGVFFQAQSNMATALSVEHLRAFGWQREGTDWVSCGRRSFRRCREAAVENVRERARQKDPIAQSRQWHLYKEGVIDGSIAVLDSLKEAAAQGLRSAQFELAFAYHRGDFVVADRNMRDFWFRHAAEQDDSTAQYNLAANILRSQPTRARALLKKLAERGFVPATKLLKKSRGADQARHRSGLGTGPKERTRPGLDRSPLTPFFL